MVGSVFFSVEEKDLLPLMHTVQNKKMISIGLPNLPQIRCSCLHFIVRLELGNQLLMPSAFSLVRGGSGFKV